MRIVILILFTKTLVYSADLIVQIRPDSIYVGTLATMTISMVNFDNGESPKYPDMLTTSDMYTIEKRVLYNHSVDYPIQFWDAGSVTIPSIPISLSKHNQEIIELWTDELQISVLSNINTHNSTLRAIKPLHDLEMVDLYQRILYLALLIIGFLLFNQALIQSGITLSLDQSPPPITLPALQTEIDLLSFLLK